MTVRGHSSQWHLLIRQIRVRDYKAVTAHVSSTFPSPSFFSQDYSWSLSLSLYLSHFLPCILNNSSLSQFKVFIYTILLTAGIPFSRISAWLDPAHFIDFQMNSHLLRQVFSVDFFLLFLSYSLIHLVIPLMSMITS